ncbi:hypothetical protein IMZ31_19315 (plasmid) [Pontibacillus sp. ALD_SL1]|uniref:Wadjet anti-phage system protein JetD domain-containing protein n=1 Tax=Pontibacillus sp. ALD_SL1 TaxID=2777185 RepID=UPI001A96844B|nr:Wadjet anti-phage system protein JetD domain-containing protein [Pontibacillus sp. ALD_SL1]QST02700.1 hypothetical protein IMZ31_19315 [Pontibacillus sp. ALD_SL1]
MKTIILSFLQDHKRKKVNISQLEEYMIRHHKEAYMDYDAFAETINELTEEEILIGVGGKKTTDFNGLYPPLYNQYWNRAQKEEAKPFMNPGDVTVHDSIDLSYYRGREEELHKDWPFIEKISLFLSDEYPAEDYEWLQVNERSAMLFGDEKWLKKHSAFLNRIGLEKEDLRMIHTPEPFSYKLGIPKAVPSPLKGIIIENSDTYASIKRLWDEGALPFQLIIYGGGKRIESTINYLQHIEELSYYDLDLYYFGDIDREGVAIWERTARGHKGTLKPYLPFYNTLVDRFSDQATEPETDDRPSLAPFLVYFTKERATVIRNVLDEGNLLPQEYVHYGIMKRLVKRDG